MKASSTSRRASSSSAPWRRSSRARPACARPRRLDARLLHALRLDAEQRDRRRLRGYRRRLGPVQAHQPQAGHRHRQHRRRVHGLRPRLGGHVPRFDGPVSDALGRGDRRGAAHSLQFLQQFLRHGRADRRRDDGLQDPRPRRRRRESREHARRARRRLQSPRRRRGRRAQEEAPPRGPGPGPPRHDHLPRLRAFPLGRLELSIEGRDRALAGSRPHRSLRGLSRPEQGGVQGRARGRARGRDREARFGGQARDERERVPPRRRLLHRVGHALQRQGREARGPEAGDSGRAR